MKSNEKTVCFTGHRKVKDVETIKNKLISTVEKFINDGFSNFITGGARGFDTLAAQTVLLLKEKYPHIKRIYVRAEFPYIDDSYRNYLLERFEDTYYPEKMIDAGKAAYIERNYEMINKSKYCIVFYDENYVPPKRKHSRKDLIEYQPQSGTKLAYEYAVKKCVVINTKK